MSAEYVSSALTKVYKCSKKIRLIAQDKRLCLKEEEKEKIQAYWAQSKKK